MTYDYPPELVQALLIHLNQNHQEIVDRLSNSFIDLRQFLALMMQLLENIEPNTSLYESYLDFISRVGVGLIMEESDSTNLFLESIGLGMIVEFAKRFSNKRDALCAVIYFFSSKDSATRLRVL